MNQDKYQPLQVSASVCHFQGVYSNKGTQVQRVIPDTDHHRSAWIDVLDLCSFFNRLPEDGTPVPKQVGVNI